MLSWWDLYTCHLLLQPACGLVDDQLFDIMHTWVAVK
uniref:Uncharacterized protein n=1 Tax=Arundo donax TaxID=35708 RepID=A0A0A9AFJ3_ARUDO